MNCRRSIGRPHIAQIMVQKGYVKSAKEAFNLFIGEGKCCYDPGIAFSVEETLDVIHRSGGKAFVAHPHLLANGAKMRVLLKEPFDGLECYYAHSYPALEKRWIKMAKEKNWLISGGSDFHGAIRPQILSDVPGSTKKRSIRSFPNDLRPSPSKEPAQ